ncbi:AraC family transcriptional regulator [Inquilinus limosus]|uniref:AraC family transcriptional regulator n=1 Tax=Inquilinus limosus TaxID=171674 RepID=UPI0004193BA2|nr:AraC family transcriptional regulator [Inquilinus limosus]
MGSDEWVTVGLDQRFGVERFRAHFTAHCYERHAHETYAIGLTEAGSQSFTCRGATHSTRPGSVITFNPAEIHDGHATNAEGFLYRMLYVEPETVSAVLDDAGIRLPWALGFPAILSEDPALAALIARTVDAFAEPGATLARSESLAAMLVALARRLAGAPAPTLLHPGDAALARVRDHLHAHLGEDVTVEDLAAVAGLSRFHMSRAFARRYGAPPATYLRWIRLERAKRLLATGEAPAQVAAATGFTDQAHLTRRFKGAYGITPAWFQKAARAA